MTQHLCDHLLDYFNGHLSELEKAAFEKHLETCSECQEELLELQELSDYLPYASNPIIPPKGLEDRVFAQIDKDTPFSESVRTEPIRKQKRNRWILPSIAAVLVLSLIGNIYFFNELNGSNQPDSGEVAIDKVLQSVELAAVEGNAKGTASMIKQGQQTSMVIQASELGKLSNKEVYQVWLIKDDKPERAGTFVPSEDGKGSVVYQLSQEFAKKDWDTVAITLEPDANSKLPKGNIVLASKL